MKRNKLRKKERKTGFEHGQALLPLLHIKQQALRLFIGDDTYAYKNLQRGLAFPDAHKLESTQHTWVGGHVKHCQSHSSDSATHWHGHGPTFCSSFTAFPPTNNRHKLQLTDVHVMMQPQHGEPLQRSLRHDAARPGTVAPGSGSRLARG